MIQITSLSEAFDYVKQHDLFIKENYLILEKLSDEEVNVFILKHCSLRIQKDLLPLVDGGRMYSVKNDGNYKKVILKLLVNMIKISDIVQLSSVEILQLKEEKSPLLVSDIVTMMLSGIAMQCEPLDRHNDPQNITNYMLAYLKIKEDVMKKAWAGLLSHFKEELIQPGFNLEVALIQMSSVLKSV